MDDFTGQVGQVASETEPQLGDHVDIRGQTFEVVKVLPGGDLRLSPVAVDEAPED